MDYELDLAFPSPRRPEQSFITRMLQEFHATFRAPLNLTPTVLDRKNVELRARLIEEEAEEAAEALRSSTEDGDNAYLREVAKELADSVYVAYGTAVALGIDLDTVLRKVHESNMSKVHPDGTVRYRKDGKVLKPDTYKPPNLEYIG